MSSVHMQKAREMMKMMSINQLSCYHVLLEVRKILMSNSSEHLKQKLIPSEEPNYGLRSFSRGDLKVPCKPSRGCVGFSYHGSKCYNMLPETIRQIKGAGPFKREMKKWVMTNIPD